MFLHSIKKILKHFFSIKKVKKAKTMLGLNKINVKRIDLLDEENQKKYRDIEETRQLIYTDL